ncbi:MAG: PAS domain S-box protein [Sedimentisphaerales bacterium]|nr:PAS domain S-box protein [Sedimentisphaerales bacterium]
MSDNHPDILLIEDNVAHTELIRRAFKVYPLKMNLTTCHTCEEAQEYLTKHTPDLVLGDINLPDGQCLNLFQTKQRNHKYPILIMTGHGNEDLAVQMMKAGAFDYIVKTESSLLLMPQKVEQALKEWEDLSVRKDTHKALLRAEEQLGVFKNFAEASKQGLGMADLNGYVIYCNETLAKVFMGEKSPEDAIGKHVSIYYEEKIQKRLQDEILPYVIKHGEWTEEIPLLSIDGKLTPAIQSIFLIHDEQGRPAYIANVITDITKQKRQQKELETINVQLEESIEHSNILAEELSIIGHTHNMRVKELNCLYSLSGLFESSDNPLEEIFQKTVDIIPPAFQFPEFTCARLIYDNQYYITKGFIETPWKISSDINCNGLKCGVLELYYLEEWFSTDEGPFSDEEKRLIEEISERLELYIGRRVSESLVKAANDFLQSVLESVTSMIFVLDLEGRFTLVSKACPKITGYEVEALTNKPLSLLFTPDIFQEINKQLAFVQDLGGIITHYETEINRLDGACVSVSINMSPLYENDIIIRIVGTIDDITQRKKLETQLLQSQKLKSIGQLASGIAHEINTPTQYIGDNIAFLNDASKAMDQLLEKYNELLAGCRKDPVYADLIEELEGLRENMNYEYIAAEIPQAIQHTLEGVEHISEIVHAIKEFSHPGTKEKTAIDINRGLESTITVTRNQWKQVADITTDFDDDLPLVECLPGELNQVFLNLIINATDAIAEVVGDGDNGKGTITISTHKHGESVEIRIRDTGPGIPRDIQNKIFDPFFTTKKVGQGTGQGLAIAHSIITDKHNGLLTFETKPGEGSTFIIRLPIKDSGKSAACPDVEKSNTLEQPVIPSSVFDMNEVLPALGGDIETLKGIMDIYLDVLHIDIQELKKGIAHRDLERILQDSIKIKDAAAHIGAKAVQQIAYQMEQTAREGKQELYDHLLKELEQELNRLVGVLDTLD